MLKSLFLRGWSDSDKKEASDAQISFVVHGSNPRCHFTDLLIKTT